MQAYEEIGRLLDEYRQLIKVGRMNEALIVAMQIRTAAQQLVVEAAMQSAPNGHVYQFRLEL
jgi:hypothetical protein